MNAILAIIQLALVPILLAVALGVRFVGSARALNVVDYARVADPVALHRWAGNRLLLLPVASMPAGLASWHWPAWALLFAGGAVLAALLVGIRIALGAERFQAPTRG